MTHDEFEDDGPHEAIIYGEDGLPAGVADLDKISTRGIWLGFALAAECGHLDLTDESPDLGRFSQAIAHALEDADGMEQPILKTAAHTLTGLLNDALNLAGPLGDEMRENIRAVLDGGDYPSGGRG